MLNLPMNPTLFTLAAALGLAAASELSAKSETIFVGTYTNTSSRGIYTVQFDSETGKLSPPSLAAAIPSPSFLALSPDRKRLYAVEESKPGKVNAFAVDASSDHLTWLNSRLTGGDGPAHLALDPAGQMVIAANYGGGSVCSFPLEPDGSLGKEGTFLAHHGPLGPDQARQKEPHPHSVTFSLDGRFAFVCDLGSDQVVIYRVDASQGSIAPSKPRSGMVPAGAGPRHSVFSADGHFLYVLNEMGGSVCVFAWDSAGATLTLKQTISSLPEGFSGKNGSAEIAIGQSGKFLYASNRGPDTIAAFSRDGREGKLALVDLVPCGGSGPRNFVLSPEGKWLICANQQSDNLVVFRIDPKTGRIKANGETASVARPVCLVFSGR